MSSKIDPFIVASYAIWAGDFTFAEALLSESTFSRPIVPTTPIDLPAQLIARIGASRLRQLHRRRDEFDRLASDSGLSSDPLVLQTPHLRATVWRHRDREFQMQAYLTDLSWEEHLFELVALRSKSFSEPDQTPTEFAGRFYPLARAWTEPGSPFLQVEVTDLGQIEVSMFWTAPDLPANSQALIEPLRQFLQTLDPPLR